MGEEAEEYLIDLEPGMYQMIYWDNEGPHHMSYNNKLDYVLGSIADFWGEDQFIEKMNSSILVEFIEKLNFVQFSGSIY